MDVCGEHGSRSDDEIAHVGSTCPACSQIEELKSEHEQEVSGLKDTISDLEDQITESGERE